MNKLECNTCLNSDVKMFVANWIEGEGCKLVCLVCGWKKWISDYEIIPKEVVKYL